LKIQLLHAAINLAVGYAQGDGFVVVLFASSLLDAESACFIRLFAFFRLSIFC